MQSDKEKAIPTDAPEGSQHAFPLDTKQIAEAVVELNILRKNVQIYFPGHDQVQRSLDRAYETLILLLEVNSSLTLGIAKDTLMIGDAVLDPDNAVFKEFALALKSHDIATVTFEKDVQTDELLRFLKLISGRPSEVKASGGIETAFSNASLQHIAIRTVDYTQFYLTDEAEAVNSESKDKAEDTDQIWRDFISHFVSGTLSQSEQDISVENLEKYSPAKLAQALNSGQVGNVTALDTYDRIVSKHLRYTASRKGSAYETNRAFSSLNLLLQELSPELRRQFLSITFKRCAPRSNIPETETFLRGLSENFVVDMLRHATAEGKEISPSLLSLVQKIANIEGIQTGAPLVDPAGAALQPLRGKLQQLFKREDHEAFVVPEYDSLLQKIGRVPSIDPDAEFPLEQYLETLTSPHLDIQIARVVIAFLEMNVSADEYEDYAGQLLEAVPVLITSGAFSILHVIFETFSRHQAEKPDAGVRSAAEAALKKMKGQELVKKAVRVFDRRQAPDDAKAFLLDLGTEIVPEAVSILANREVAVKNDPFYQLLDRFREETISEIEKRLNDARFHVLNNMLLLVQALNAKEMTDLMRPLLDHPDSIVRMQALKTFLDFKNPDAVPHLKSEIQSNWADIVSQAIDWAGQFKIKETVPDLLSKMKRIAIFKSDLQTNEKIIEALGKIGDPASIEPLLKLVDDAFTLSRKQRVQMRRALFESLAGYPFSEVVPQIKAGYQSEDKEIRRICQKIRKKFGATAEI